MTELPRHHRIAEVTKSKMAHLAMAGLVFLGAGARVLEATTDDPILTPSPTPTEEESIIPTVESTPTPISDARFAFFGHNQATMDDVTNSFAPYLRAGDVITVRAFNYGVYEQDSLINNAQMLREKLPQGVKLYARVHGADEATQAVNDLPPGLYDGILFAYDEFEGGWTVPEFSWDSDTTYANFSRVKEIANNAGYKMWVLPTGRPVMVTNPPWDYGIGAESTDGISPQLQGYCQNTWFGDDPRTFDQAVEIVAQQMDARGVTQDWMPQLTIGTELSNGAPWDTAVSCAKEALQKGANGIMIQWTQGAVQDTVEFLKTMGRESITDPNNITAPEDEVSPPPQPEID